MGVLSRLQVCGFRNLRHLDLTLGRGVTLLLGSNGQGKSNILEAVCYLALLRSFRTQGILDLRQWDADGFSIRGQVDSEDAAQRLTLAVTQAEKRHLQVNGTAVDRASDFINRFLCVPLVPEDLEMIKGAAAVRRRFLDVSISQRWPQYLVELQCYRAAVGSRNLALRNPSQFPVRVLDAYEEQVVRHGSRIEVARRRYVRDLGDELATLSGQLLGSTASALGAAYSCPGIGKESGDSEDAVAALLSRALQRSRERDQRDGHTSAGPHRADLAVLLAGRALAAYGSEGECRLASLALRLAALAIARQGGGGKAVVALVDDVFGELDAVRRRAFFGAVAQADQVLVSATAHPAELRETTTAVFGVRNGSVERL